MTAIEQAPSELAETKSRLVHRPRVEHLLTAGTVVGLLGLWTLLSHYGLVNPLFLPSPEAVWNSFLEVLTEGYQGQRLHPAAAAACALHPARHVARHWRHLEDYASLSRRPAAALDQRDAGSALD
jgi:hypothetical protein